MTDPTFPFLCLAAITTKGGIFPVFDMDFEVGRSAAGTFKAVITLGSIATPIWFELVQVLKDIEGHRSVPAIEKLGFGLELLWIGIIPSIGLDL